MCLDKCFICGSKEELWFCYPVAGLPPEQGAKLCKEHQRMRYQEPEKLYELIMEKQLVQSKSVKRRIRTQLGMKMDGGE